LHGLYDVLQTLESVPLDRRAQDRGERFPHPRHLATTRHHVFAELKGGRIKGWMLISTPGNADRDARILQVLRQTFARPATRRLTPAWSAMEAETKARASVGA
jgi:hypothetical protein